MNQVLVLTREEVQQLITIKECNDAVALAFKEEALGRANNLPALAQVQDNGTRFGLKAGYLAGKRTFGLKTISSFASNPERYGLPKIQATIFLWEGQTGKLVAMMDGTYITAIRTGSAGAVGARHLAGKVAERVAVIGTGVQGRAQLTALAAEMPIGEVLAWGPNTERRAQYAGEMRESLGLPVRDVASIEEAVCGADVIITATWSYEPLVRCEWVKPGAYIAAIGADAPGMQELDPALLSSAKVVVDDLAQCSRIGELNVPLKAGTYDASKVHGTIGEVIAGLKPGRQSATEVTIFDSTGVGLQDVVVAEAVYQKALAAGIGTTTHVG